MTTDDKQHRGRSGAAFRDWHLKTKPKLPRCGARARSTGEPCRQVAMPNGRCAYHGGRTPKGDHWHKPRWPNSGRPDWNERLNLKLAGQERAARKRAERLAAMSPEERQQHADWHRTHKPGKSGERKRLRAKRKADADMRKVLAQVDQPISADPAVGELEREIDGLERRLREAASAAPAPRDHDIFD